MVGTVGAMVSFQEGSQLLDELAGVQVDAKQVERYAEALGAEIAADERCHVAPMENGALPSTLYLGIDGTGIPMRTSELTGRAGKQPDGSARTREVKLCTVWSAEMRDADDVPVRDSGSVTYSAAIESAATLDTDESRSAFSERVLREAGRRRFTEAEHTVVIGDGAAWIWNIAGELFPHAVQIVDRFHVKETIYRTAHAIYGASSERAAQWAGKRCKELDDGHVPKLLRALDRHAASWEEARKCALYIRRNRDRMRYPNSAPGVSAPLPVLSKRDAKLPSEPASNAPACTGPFAALTLSSPFAAAVSADAFRTSGNAEPTASPLDRHFSVAHPC